ncbi:MAG: ABC transporter permease [Anaerolineae bacterium]|nr:ABC transporter permease [Anaerolineae bacterium]
MDQDRVAARVDLGPEKVDPRLGSEDKIFVATQWQLMWWKFRKHRLAIIGGIVLILLYTTAILADFIAPHDPNLFNKLYPYAPPQPVRFADENGLRLLQPYVYGLKRERDPTTLGVVFEVDTEVRYPVRLFVHSHPYKFWGLFDSDLHLLGADVDPEVLEETFFLLGSDRLGRDQLSRILYGTRISLSIGLLGMSISFFLGILLGGISGYYGGIADNIIQRIIEFLRSVPSTPLWMALSAALPPTWPALRVYFGITIILSLISWTGLARVVRSKFLSLREEDFVMAAKLCGTTELRIIFRHLLPSFLSHIIASLTLSIPGLILSETSLSFIGLGLRPPTISWGVLMKEAQNLVVVAQAPWLLIPGILIVITVLSFNFMGDGLRDAADPYVR